MFLDQRFDNKELIYGDNYTARRKSRLQETVVVKEAVKGTHPHIFVENTYKPLQILTFYHSVTIQSVIFFRRCEMSHFASANYLTKA